MASMFQIGFFQNTNYANKDIFCKSGHIYCTNYILRKYSHQIIVVTLSDHCCMCNNVVVLSFFTEHIKEKIEFGLWLCFFSFKINSNCSIRAYCSNYSGQVP